MFKTKLLAAGLLLAGLALAAPAAHAATTNASPGADVVVLPVHLPGQHTADAADIAAIKIPFEARVLGVSATARASGGTNPTLTVDVQEDGSSILSTPVAVTAGTVAEASVSDTVLADEATLTLDLAIGGTSPTWDDVTVLLTVIRR